MSIRAPYLSDLRRKLAATTQKGAAMCWKCDHPNADNRRRYFDELRAAIREHGWVVQYVESDRTHTHTRSDCTTGTYPNS